MEVNLAKIAISSAIYSIDKPYSYVIPFSMRDKLQVGMRVIVPFGRSNKPTEGVVLQLVCEKDLTKLKFVAEILDKDTIIDERVIKLAFFIKNRYFSTFYEALRVILPSGFWFSHENRYVYTKNEENREIISKETYFELENAGYAIKTKENAKEIDFLVEKKVLKLKTHSKAKAVDKIEKFYSISNEYEPSLVHRSFSVEKRQKVIEFLQNNEKATFNDINYFTGVSKAIVNTLEKQEIIIATTQKVYRDFDIDYSMKDIEIKLSKEQQKVYEGIEYFLNDDKFSQSLLYGVTGSGKTQIYLKLIEKCLENGKGAIVLIPEIALTTQILSKFTEKFGNNVALIHSKLSVNQRYETYKKIQNGECNVVIGTRSAVFSPLKNLGLIIIDEEHEETYKSENSPRYDAREVAKYIAYLNNVLVLYASATPSIKTYYLAKNGDINMHKLTKRYANAVLPEVYIDDMCKLKKYGTFSHIGPLLYEEIQKNMQNKEQTILYLNRRGNSNQFICMECGYVAVCENCSANMTYHSINERLMCHLCGYSFKKPDICPSCYSRHVKTEGCGTQKLEQELITAFEGVKILRFDADTTKNKNSHSKILNNFKNNEADILLGTQMVTKGLDFDNVTLVGVVDADASLFADSYKALENTFSKITQVVGRAGRSDKKGRAIIQTYNPENEVILLAKEQNYEQFYENEILRRGVLKLPPIYDIFAFVITADMQIDALNSALSAKDFINNLKQYQKLNLQVLGPQEAKIHKLNKKFRYIINIRLYDTEFKLKFIQKVLKEFFANKKNKGSNIYVNLDGEC